MKGMQPDFEKNFFEFLEKARLHFEHQNAALSEYAKFFEEVSKVFPRYAQFVQDVMDSLEPSTILKPQSRSLAKPSSAETKKILIVDDAEINRILLGHFFKNVPVSLEFAINGDQAMEKIRNHRFDLILMDLQLKDQSGIEVIQMIREALMSAVPRTLIVAISNLEPSDDEKDRALNAGSDEYLTKSLSRDLMKDRIFSILYGNETISA